ncbi:3001_t:CDS:2 [Entrophospora sp. SA101]|nr:3001_t:CDS:2 [Entrophospora sp. SA101]
MTNININKESVKQSKFLKLETYKKFTKNHIIKPYKKNPIITSAIYLIILSSLLLFILLVGSLQSVYLSRFVFDEPIQTLIKKQQISFTLYSYCLDNVCSDPSFIHNFDQIPSVEEIVEGIESKFTKRFIDPNQVGGTVGDTVENGVDKAKEFGSNAGDTVSNTAGDVINKINELSPTMLDIIALLFLSTFFVALSLTFDMLLFVWVFKAVALIPGLGQQKTGSGIHLAAWSLIFLTVATILMMIGVCNKMCISGIVKKLRRNKLSPSDEKNQTLTSEV